MRVAVMLLGFATFLPAGSDQTHIKGASAAYQAGEISAHDKQFQRAIDEFRRAIDIEPTFRDAFDGLINACLNAGRRPDAARAVTQLLEIEPDVTRYRVLLGQILMEENQPERALAQFSFVLQIEPVNPDALLGFAAAAKQLGMQDRAAEALARGKKQYPLDARFN